jgi:hypothetical protein
MFVRIKGLRLNEEVTIPPELANQYLSVKKQVLDRQTKKDSLMKSVNQVDNEINILSKNLIAIETKAAEMTGQKEQSQEKAQQQAAKTSAEAAQQQAQAVANAPTVESFSIDDWWRTHVTEGDTQDLDDYMNHEGDWSEEDDEDPEIINEPDEVEDGESLEGDYVFTLKIEVEDEEEDIIAKFYKNEDDDYWRVRVVQGDEQPLEDMQFDPELDMVEIIEKIAEIPGYIEIEEMETQEYQDLLDDKEIIDNAFYDDIIKEE